MLVTYPHDYHSTLRMFYSLIQPLGVQGGGTDLKEETKYIITYDAMLSVRKINI